MSVHFNSPLFKLKLSPKEYHAFMAMLPFVEITSEEDEKEKALSIIGIDNEIIYDLLSHHDRGLVNAFRIILLLLNMRHDLEELSVFLNRIEFVDEAFRRRLMKALRRPFVTGENVISADELNGMWKMESAFDDGGEPIT